MTDDTQDQSGVQPQGESFGFANQSKSEKYNTEFLVASLEKDKQRTKLIVLGVLVAVIGLVAMLVALSGGEKESPKPKPGEPPAAAAPAQPAEH
jgi:hypothetical protein